MCKKLVDYQKDDYPEDVIEDEQRKLNQIYDDFTNKYGLLNSRGNSIAFREDSAYYLLCSLENINEDGTLNFNPNSLTVLKDCVLEPSLKDAKAYDSFQFVRNGFFCVDCKDSEEGKPVFNRIVSLKSSFKLPK